MTDIVEKLNKAPPREVCEHGSQRIKCPVCELAEAEAEIERLRTALEAMAHHPTGGVGCNPVEFVRAAAVALNVQK